MKTICQYDMFEITLTGQALEGSHVQVDCSATFEQEDGKQHQIKGFYRGNGVYAIRFMPKSLGKWTYRIQTPAFAQAQGSFECVSPTPGNHGPVQVKHTHFQYADASKYIPVGTTCYAWIHQPQEIISQTESTLKESPFNKIRMCIFPKEMVYNTNDPELYPFHKNDDGNWDVHRPNFAFWDHLEDKLQVLMQMGIEADLILFHPYDQKWGFNKLSREDNLIYLDYSVRRLSAFRNIWWSVANEYDMVFDRTVEEWDELGIYLHQEDPYGHLLSIHNWLHFYDFSKDWISHCSVQTAYVHQTETLRNQYLKPVINDECQYEGDIEEGWGNLSAFELVHRFWGISAKGGFCTHGETYYNENEVLWWSKGGKLQGESVARIAFLKELLYELDGDIQPVPGRFAINPNDLASMDQHQLEQIQQNPYAKTIMQLKPADLELFSMQMTQYQGSHNDQYILHYLGKSCQSILWLDLPENHEYNVELIDIWEMKRTQLVSGATGRTKLQFAGKEGLAILASKMDS